MIRILVADGSPASLSLAKRFLEGEGYGVITASSGIEAIEKVFSERPDLVLLDIELPAKDGFSVCEAIKENPETAEIPVLIFTRLSRREDRERGLKAGADDYLVKPFSAKGLLRAIRKHIRRSRKIEVPSEGYILRISRDDWEREVYASKRYYVGVPRKWKTGLIVFFARKTDIGDSIIGYGITGTVKRVEEIDEAERERCKEKGWRWVLNFTSMVRFRHPLPIKDTVLGKERAKGKTLHGLPLDRQKILSIIHEAEGLTP